MTILINGSGTGEVYAAFGQPLTLALSDSSLSTTQTWDILPPIYDDGTETDRATNWPAWTLNADGSLSYVDNAAPFSIPGGKPDVPESWLVRCTETRTGVPNVIHSAVFRVRNPKTGDAVPAAAENIEASTLRGWWAAHKRNHEALNKRGQIRVYNGTGATLAALKVCKVGAAVDWRTVGGNANPGGSATRSEKTFSITLADTAHKHAARHNYCVLETAIPNGAFGWAVTKGDLAGNFAGLLQADRKIFSDLTGGLQVYPVGQTCIEVGTCIDTSSTGKLSVDFIVHKDGEETEPSWFGADEDITTNDTTALQSAITYATTYRKNKTVHISGGLLISTASATLPGGCTLRFEDGGYLTGSGLATLTIAAKVSAGPYRIFTGACLSYAGGFNTPVNPRWFGALGNGVTNDSVAFQAALGASSFRTLKAVPGDTYLVEGMVTPPSITLDLTDATILKKTTTLAGAAPPLFSCTGPIHVIGGTVDGQRVADLAASAVGLFGGSYSGNVTRTGFTLDGAAYDIPWAVFEGVDFVDLLTNGINSQDVFDIAVMDCTFTNTGGQAMHIEAQLVGPPYFARLDSIKITGCTIDGAGDYLRAVTGSVTNMAILGGTKLLVMANNRWINYDATNTGGIKVQTLIHGMIANDTYIDCDIKPSTNSTVTLGQSLTVSGCTFRGTDPLNFTQPPGLFCGNYYRIFKVIGNTFINSTVLTDRSSDIVHIIGNTFIWDADPGVHFYCISANDTNSPSKFGKLVVEGNVAIGNNHPHVNFAFVDPYVGRITYKNNDVSGVNCVFFQTPNGACAAGSDMRIQDNVFKQNRALGRIRCGDNLTLRWLDNVIDIDSPAAPLAISSGSPSVAGLQCMPQGTWPLAQFNGNEWRGQPASVETAPVRITDADGTPVIARLETNDNVYVTGANWVYDFNLYAGLALTVSKWVARHNEHTAAIRKESLVNVTAEDFRENAWPTGLAGPYYVGLATSPPYGTGAVSATIGAAGAASAPPATPEKYITINRDGTLYKLPAYLP